MLIVWAVNLESYDEWDGTINVDDVAAIDLNDGFRISASRLWESGEPTTQIIYKTETMEKMGLLNLTKYKSPTPPQVTEQDWTMVIIVVFVMIIACIIGAIMKGQVGAVIIVLAIVIGGITILLLTGILQGWIGSLIDRLKPGWWPW